MGIFFILLLLRESPAQTFACCTLESKQTESCSHVTWEQSIGYFLWQHCVINLFLVLKHMLSLMRSADLLTRSSALFWTVGILNVSIHAFQHLLSFSTDMLLLLSTGNSCVEIQLHPQLMQLLRIPEKPLSRLWNNFHRPVLSKACVEAQSI